MSDGGDTPGMAIRGLAAQAMRERARALEEINRLQLDRDLLDRELADCRRENVRLTAEVQTMRPIFVAVLAWSEASTPAERREAIRVLMNEVDAVQKEQR